jgi:glyoxylase-like metal-dependent hydrolase (beta-lactamase superfamily II)
LHPDDAGMVEHGDTTWNRNKPIIIIQTIMGLLIDLKAADRFKPDIYLKAGDQLSEYGLEAEVISIPGHFQGSIGILTKDYSTAPKRLSTVF